MKYYILTALICLSLFCGCSKKQKGDYSFTVVQKQALVDFFCISNNMNFLLKGVTVSQDHYCVPNEAWVKEVYVPFVKDFNFKNRVWQPKDPRNNCFKFSSYGLTAGHVLHATGASGGPQDTSLSIGITDYVKSFWEWHSVNFFVIVDENKNLKLIYYDPMYDSFLPSKDVEPDWVMIRM